MSEDFTNIVRIGTKQTPGGRFYSVFAAIHYQGGKLSITGVEGPLRSGNCVGSCGQIERDLKGFHNFAKGWSFSKLQTFRKFWREWHLNHIIAGSPWPTKEVPVHVLDFLKNLPDADRPHPWGK